MSASSGRRLTEYEEYLPEDSRAEIIEYDKPKGCRRGRERMIGTTFPEHPPIKVPALVTGTGRCGTLWLTKVLQKADFDVGHECILEDGTVSLWMQRDHHWYVYCPWDHPHHLGQRRASYQFQHEVLLVRHPLKCIASLTQNMSALTRLWYQEVGLVPVTSDRLLFAMFCWYNVNQQDLPFFKMETLDVEWYAFLDAIGFQQVDMPDVTPKNRGTGFRKPPELTWDDLRKKDRNLARLIRELAADHLGYEET